MVFDLLKKMIYVVVRPLKSGKLMASLFFSVFLVIESLVVSCNNTNTDPEDTVGNAMDVNEQKAKGSALPVQTSDADFIVKAANDGMTELKMGHLAKEKATNKDLQAFAEKIVKDHSKISDRLRGLADSLNVTLPTTIDEAQQEDFNKLSNTAVKDFDKVYIDMVVKAQDGALKLFEHASKDILTPSIHSFVIDVLPALKAHQEAIKYLDKTQDK